MLEWWENSQKLVLSFKKCCKNPILADNDMFFFIYIFHPIGYFTAQTAGHTLPDATGPVGQIHPSSEIAVTFEQIQPIQNLPQSNFLSTVIFNLTMSPFLAFFAISLKLVRCTESVRQRNHRFVTKKGVF